MYSFGKKFFLAYYTHYLSLQSDTNYKASLRDAPCTITELKRQMSTQMSQQSEKPQITKESRDMQAIPKSHKSYSYHGISSALSGIHGIIL